MSNVQIDPEPVLVIDPDMSAQWQHGEAQSVREAYDQQQGHKP